MRVHVNGSEEKREVFRRAAPRKTRPLGGQRVTRSERAWGPIFSCYNNEVEQSLGA